MCIVRFNFKRRKYRANVTEACRIVGEFSYAQVRSYACWKGKSISEAFYDFLEGHRPSEEPHGKTFTYKGKVKKNMKKFCRELGIPYNNLQQKLYQGYGMEEAVELVLEGIRKKEAKKEALRGILVRRSHNSVYNSVQEMCDEYEVPLSMVSTRIKKGMTPAQALTDAIRKRNNLFINGIQYRTFGEACRANGLTDSAVRQYAGYHKMDLYRALRYLIEVKWQRNESKTPHSIEVDGIVFPSLYKACLAYDLSYNNVIGYAFRKDCTHQQAFDHYRGVNPVKRIFSNTPKNWIKCVFSKKEQYDSMLDACFRKDVLNHLSAIRRRYYLGEKPEEAIQHYLPALIA